MCSQLIESQHLIAFPEEKCVRQGRPGGCKVPPLLVFSKAFLTWDGLYIHTVGTLEKTDPLG